MSSYEGGTSLIFVGFWAIYQTAVGSGHWVCVCVTMAVTTTTAYVMSDSMTGIGAWLVALVAGGLSGTASMYAHRAFAKLLGHYPKLATKLARSHKEWWEALTSTLLNARLWLFAPTGYQYRMRLVRD